MRMTIRIIAWAGIFALVSLGASPFAVAQPAPPLEGPAANGSPAWFTYLPPPPAPGRAVGPGGAVAPASAYACSHSPICTPRPSSAREIHPLARIQWKQTMGYTISYPFAMPQNPTNGGGGVSSVAIDSKGNLWAFQRNPEGHPQLFEFDSAHRLIRTVGENVIGHQVKPHGIAVDSQDNVWICDETGATVMEVSPDGRLLKTIGTKNKRGDWDESKGQRLLWEPLAIAFAANGDMYIGQGHANESPNDTDSADPANMIGASRILHLDPNGRFVSQWYGDVIGPGKFSMAHGLAVDPRSGDIWVGDREQYRIVVFTSGGQFLRTIQSRNLTCTIQFDPAGNPWMASGTDGQVLKIDRDGKVLGAIGNGPGRGEGQFSESNYLAWDRQGNIYSGDTVVGRITMMTLPR
jgi:DNA-binding beta-propeller fold protein YncE